MTVIAVDLDDVLAVFKKSADKEFGSGWEDWSKNVFWKKMAQFPDFYKNIEPFHYAKELIEKLSHHDVYILTAIPKLGGKLDSAAADKTEWVRKHVSSTLEVKTVVGGVNKGVWFAKPGHVLIDDRYRNILAWEENGCIGLRHTSYDDTLSRLKHMGLIH